MHFSMFVDDLPSLTMIFANSKIILCTMELPKNNGFYISMGEEEWFFFLAFKDCYGEVFFFKLEPPKVNLNGANVPVIETTEFIGFTWDSKLSLVPHINKLMDSCMKSSNLLRSVSSYHIDIVENERIVTQG